MDQVQNYVDTARVELENPTFYFTKHWLARVTVEKENGLASVARIDEDFNEDEVAIYFSVAEELFFLVVNVDTKPEIKASSAWIESGNRAELTATSTTLNHQELARGLKLGPLTGWSKGEPARYGKRNYKFSRVSFRPQENRAFCFEEALDNLLTELEKDPEGVRELTLKADALISFERYQYFGANAGVEVDAKAINRLASLNLGLDLDTYISSGGLTDQWDSDDPNFRLKRIEK